MNDVAESMKTAIILEEAKVGARRMPIKKLALAAEPAPAPVEAPKPPPVKSDDKTHPPILSLEQDRPRPPPLPPINEEEQRAESALASPEKKLPEHSFTFKRGGTKKAAAAGAAAPPPAPESKKQPAMAPEIAEAADKKREEDKKVEALSAPEDQSAAGSFSFKRSRGTGKKTEPPQTGAKPVEKPVVVVPAVVEKKPVEPPVPEPVKASMETAETFDEENDYPFDEGWKCSLL